MSTDSQPQPDSGAGSGTEPRPPVLTATELRQVAEWAHSVRGPHMAMVVSRLDDGSLKVEPKLLANAPRGKPEFLVIPVDTENRVRKRRVIGGMNLRLVDKEKMGAPSVDVNFFQLCREAHGCEPDAMFWTESAVEKFLVPYYASVHSADKALGREMRRIAKVFDGKFKPKGRTLEHDEEVTVYAMVHLPKSEYVASPPEEPTMGVLYSIHRRGADPVPMVEKLSLLEPL